MQLDRPTDPIDLATEQETMSRDASIAAVRRSLVGESRKSCVACDEPIDEMRRALGGVTRCLDCQKWAELKAKRAKR